MPIIETKKIPRVVIDTNIIISSLISNKGDSFTVIERFKQNHFTMYINANLIREYDNKINQFVKEGLIKDSVAANKILKEIRNRAVPLRIPINPPIRCTDPKDNHVLEVAIVGNLDYIITNDSKDLPEIEGNKALGKTKIVNSKTFKEKLNKLN